MGELPHVHAAQGIHSWRDFFVHIAVVAIGLLLAIGLQQTVEYAHHRHQRAELEQQMQQTLAVNSHIIASDLRILSEFREYLVDLRAAVEASRRGEAAPAAPSATDPRTYAYAPPPILGPYQAAKSNGDLALLSLDRLRLYGRLALQYDFVLDDVRRFIDAQDLLRAFRMRFDPSAATAGFTSPVLPADLDALSSNELIEYRALIGTALEADIQYSLRLKRIEAMNRAVLKGARDENDLMKSVTAVQDSATRASPLREH